MMHDSAILNTFHLILSLLFLFKAFEFVKNARGFADAMSSSFVFSVRQPSESLLNLFDTICLMSRGVCLYWGPTADCVAYFEAWD